MGSGAAKRTTEDSNPSLQYIDTMKLKRDERLTLQIRHKHALITDYDLVECGTYRYVLICLDNIRNACDILSHHGEDKTLALSPYLLYS